jgi:hypothetical protein
MHRHHHPPLQEPSTQVVGLNFTNSGPSRDVRAGDDDRRRVMDLLQAHYVAGRLRSDELEGRFERALAARTLGDLDALLADLPRLDSSASAESESADPGDERSARRHHRREKSFRAHATSYLLVMALLVAIWLLTTPGGYFWPIWPMLGWGFGLASHGLAAWGADRRGSGGVRLAA